MRQGGAAHQTCTVTRDGVAELRAFWEIIWMLGGGLLMTMATVGAGIVALTLLIFGAGSYWLRRRNR